MIELTNNNRINRSYLFSDLKELEEKHNEIMKTQSSYYEALVEYVYMINDEIVVITNNDEMFRLQLDEFTISIEHNDNIINVVAVSENDENFEHDYKNYLEDFLIKKYN